MQTLCRYDFLFANSTTLLFGFKKNKYFILSSYHNEIAANYAKS